MPLNSDIGRRDLLQRTIIGTAAIVTGARSGRAQTTKKVAVFLPGIMGSTLRIRKGGLTAQVWSDSPCEISQVLIDNPPLLDLPPVATDTAVIKQASLRGHPIPDLSSLGLPQTKFYASIIDLLGNQHAEFKKPGSLLAFSYDWRQDCDAILAEFQEALASRFSVSYHDGQALPGSGCSFYVIGHSMGGLLAFLAIARGLIHKDDLANLILLAPPLQGAALSFRQLCEGVPIPFTDWEFRVCLHWIKNRFEALRNLRIELRKMISLYQLMPPLTERYIKPGNQPINPLSGEDTVVIPAVKAITNKLHDEIATAARSINLPERLHIFCGDGIETDNFYNVGLVMENGVSFYRTLGSPGTNSDGDGTILVNSATYGGALDSKAQVYHYPVKHDSICEDPRVLKKLGTLL